jgi:hypothetical protein
VLDLGTGEEETAKEGAAKAKQAAKDKGADEEEEE